MIQETPLERALFRWSAIVFLLASSIYFAHYYFTQGASASVKLSGLGWLSFVAGGKLVIFFGLREGFPSIWTIGAVVFSIDMACGYAVASGLAPLERAPRIGPWLRQARSRAADVLREYPGFRRLAFFGVVAFVLIPVAGAGAITGSFLARLLGLSRITGVMAIALASAWSTLAFALLARFVGERAEALLKNPVLITSGVILVAILCWFAYQHVLRELRR